MTWGCTDKLRSKLRISCQNGNWNTRRSEKCSGKCRIGCTSGVEQQFIVRRRSTVILNENMINLSKWGDEFASRKRAVPEACNLLRVKHKREGYEQVIMEAMKWQVRAEPIRQQQTTIYKSEACTFHLLRARTTRFNQLWLTQFSNLIQAFPRVLAGRLIRPFRRR